MISEIRPQARGDHHIIRSYREMRLHRQIQASSFLKTRLHHGRKVTSADAYFATREKEYRLSLIPYIRSDAVRGHLKTADFRPLVRDLRLILNGIRFTERVQPAITEAAYRTRLYILVGALIMLGCGILILLIRRWIAKKRGF